MREGSGLTSAGGQKKDRVYTQNFTGRVTLLPRKTTLDWSGNN